MVKKRRRHTVAYKFRVALEAVESSKTISQLSSEHEVHANLIRSWKRQQQEDGPRVYATNDKFNTSKRCITTESALTATVLTQCAKSHLLFQD